MSEKFLFENSELKSAPEDCAELCDSILNKVEQTIKQIGLIENQTDLPKEKKEIIKNIKNKFFKISRKFLKITGGLTLLGIIASSENYYKTKYEVNTSKDNKGNTIYKHSDPETTHILNYLAGRESLTEEEIMRNVRLIAKNSFESQNIDLPPNFDSFSIEQIDSFFASITQFKSKKGDIIKFVDDYIDRKIEPLSDIYDLIWNLEQEGNNPKVQFTVSPPSFLTDDLTSHYSSIKHTIFIDIFAIGEGPNDFIAEMAHGKQFRGSLLKRMNKDLLYTFDLLRIFLRGGLNVEKLNQEYKKLYHEKGSIEYEAHSKIQPELEKKYGKIVKSIKEGEYE